MKRQSRYVLRSGLLLGLLTLGSFLAQAGTATHSLNLRMNVRAATCTTAVVSDVNFGRQLASDILAGNVSQMSTLSIDCSTGGSAPDALTIKFTPRHPHPTLGAEGYIRADGREDVGYRLVWGDNQVGTRGEAVPMESLLTVRHPGQTRNEILLDVSAVAPDGATTLQSGAANTGITIRVTYA